MKAVWVATAARVALGSGTRSIAAARLKFEIGARNDVAGRTPERLVASAIDADIVREAGEATVDIDAAGDAACCSAVDGWRGLPNVPNVSRCRWPKPCGCGSVSSVSRAPSGPSPCRW